MRLEQGASIHLEDHGEVVQPLEQHSAPSVLELDQLVPAEARLERQRLLRQPTLQPQPADVGTDSSTRFGPAFLLLRVHPISSRRHASMSRELGIKVCPTNSGIIVRMEPIVRYGIK